MGYQDIPGGSGDCDNGHWGSAEGCGRSVRSWRGAGRKGMMVSVVSHSAADVAGGLDLEERRESWTFYF